MDGNARLVLRRDDLLSQPSPRKGEVDLCQGAHFADADHLFNAGLEGNDWRAIDIFEEDRLDEAALCRLVKTAIVYNRSQRKGKEIKKVVEANKRRYAKWTRRLDNQGMGLWGIFFDLTGAAVATAANGLPWWHIVAPLLITLVAVLS